MVATLIRANGTSDRIMRRKIGSSMGAELGSMRVTEQIDALEVSSANPIKYLIVPRVLAATFMIPILSILQIPWNCSCRCE
jgi:ABC-type transporter Mla maintaining outer membrane lipid asymmetry permease subunit MlaE